MGGAVKGKARSRAEALSLVRLARRILSAIPPVTAEDIGLEMMMERNPILERRLGEVLYTQYREAYRRGEVGGEPITRAELRQVRQEARALLKEVGMRPSPKVYRPGPSRPGWVKEISARYKFRRIRQGESLLNETVSHGYDVFRLFADLRYETREHLIALYLDGASRIIATDKLAVGTERECTCSYSGLFRNAILTGAASVILIHNHPSGRTEPSSGDIALAEEVSRLGQLARIPLADFVIIGDRRHWSAWEEGRLWDGRYIRPSDPTSQTANARRRANAPTVRAYGH